MDNDIGDFDPDLEDDRGQFLLYLLGKIVYDFNYLEHQMRALLWSYIGDINFGSAITKSLGSRSLGDVLVEYCAKTEQDLSVKNAILKACKAFEICRFNRNALAHTLNVDPADNKISWNSFSKKPAKMFESVIADEADLIAVDHDIARLAAYFQALFIVVAARTSPHLKPNELPVLDWSPMKLPTA